MDLVSALEYAQASPNLLATNKHMLSLSKLSVVEKCLSSCGARPTLQICSSKNAKRICTGSHVGSFPFQILSTLVRRSWAVGRWFRSWGAFCASRSPWVWSWELMSFLRSSNVCLWSQCWEQRWADPGVDRRLLMSTSGFHMCVYRHVNK